MFVIHVAELCWSIEQLLRWDGCAQRKRTPTYLATKRAEGHVPHLLKRGLTLVKGHRAGRVCSACAFIMSKSINKHKVLSFNI